jgi:hypothetical protein
VCAKARIERLWLNVSRSRSITCPTVQIRKMNIFMQLKILNCELNCLPGKVTDHALRRILCFTSIGNFN